MVLHGDDASPAPLNMQLPQKGIALKTLCHMPQALCVFSKGNNLLFFNEILPVYKKTGK